MGNGGCYLINMILEKRIFRSNISKEDNDNWEVLSGGNNCVVCFRIMGLIPSLVWAFKLA